MWLLLTWVVLSVPLSLAVGHLAGRRRRTLVAESSVADATGRLLVARVLGVLGPGPERASR